MYYYFCLLLYECHQFWLLCLFQHELDLVKGFGVPSQDIILGGTCKQLSQIKYAAKHNIPLLVCDNEVELRKIARYHPKAK